MTIERQNPESLGHPAGAYSLVSIAPPGCQIGVISGQTGRQPDGSISRSPHRQTVDALDNILGALKGLRQDMSDVLIFRWLVVDRTNVDAVRSARDTVLAGALSGITPPSSTMAIVGGLADLRAFVEVEAWFVKGKLTPSVSGQIGSDVGSTTSH